MLPIKYLEKLVGEDSGFIRHERDRFTAGFVEGSTIPTKFKDKIDPYLFESEVEFRYPLEANEYPIGRLPGSEDFSFSLDEELGISKTNIQGTSLNSAWLSELMSGEVNVKKSYNNFILQFLNEITLTETGDYEWNQRKIDEIFNNQALNFTVTPVVFNGGVILDVVNLPLREYIVKRVLDDYRYAAWKNILKKYNEDPDAFGNLTEEQLEELDRENLIAGEKRSCGF